MPALHDLRARPAALGACDCRVGAAPGPTAGREQWSELTGAERTVALLAAAGWTDRAIAARRGTSVRTTEAQLASVLRKLMIGSRYDIASFVPDHLVAQVRREAEGATPRRRRLHRRAPERIRR
ncbi:helix-turn-helix domain-containing protein [Nocardia testacea]|uniref:helix-turn-helix domain-containing protein n=1 Tax=Nocardia testacea TaxID=248551 RepID=UPI0033CF1B48